MYDAFDFLVCVNVIRYCNYPRRHVDELFSSGRCLHILTQSSNELRGYIWEVNNPETLFRLDLDFAIGIEYGIEIKNTTFGGAFFWGV